MRKKTATHESSKSLKTFFLYTALVLIVIIISLSIKAFMVIQQSKFDGQHPFVLAVASKGKVAKIIAFHPTKSIAVLQVTGKDVPLASVGKTLAVPLNGKVDVLSNLSSDVGVTKLLTDVVLRYNGIKADVTVYDLLRFIWLSKNIAATNQTHESIRLPLDDRKIDKTVSQLFTDEAISSENMSIQIINATNIPGMGTRLERVISNMGGNVVAVSTFQKKQTKSKIEYFGDESYTLKKVKSMLSFPVSKLNKEAVANIVITIGEDSKDPVVF